MGWVGEVRLSTEEWREESRAPLRDLEAGMLGLSQWVFGRMGCSDDVVAGSDSRGVFQGFSRGGIVG